MRKLDASWDVDVPGPDVEESVSAELDRVHFGIRIGRVSHERGDLALSDRDSALSVLDIGSTNDA